jgi:hypothetical protein
LGRCDLEIEETSDPRDGVIYEKCFDNCNRFCSLEGLSIELDFFMAFSSHVSFSSMAIWMWMFSFSWQQLTDISIAILPTKNATFQCNIKGEVMALVNLAYDCQS